MGRPATTPSIERERRRIPDPNLYCRTTVRTLHNLRGGDRVKYARCHCSFDPFVWGAFVAVLVILAVIK